MKDIQEHIDELNKLLHEHFLNEMDMDAYQRLVFVDGYLDIDWHPL